MQGNTVVVFSTSPGKRAAVEALGAQYINSKDPADMAAIAGQSLQFWLTCGIESTHPYPANGDI